MKITHALFGLAVLGIAATASAADLEDIALPAPQMEGGKPLMGALKDRHTSRSFSERQLPPEILSNLLWAAAGINRPEEGKRTAPSARNWQEVQVYAVMAQGAYLYDAKANRLTAIVPGDLRKLTGVQDFVSTAPLNLVYVADTAKLAGASSEDMQLYMGADTGFIAENVYLFCASAGLATVVRGSVDREPLAKALKMPETKKIVLAQTVGYPGE